MIHPEDLSMGIAMILHKKKAGSDRRKPAFCFRGVKAAEALTSMMDHIHQQVNIFFTKSSHLNSHI